MEQRRDVATIWLCYKAEIGKAAIWQGRSGHRLKSADGAETRRCHNLVVLQS